MKHTFSHSFATRLSIYVFSFTLIVFATIMALFYNYNHENRNQQPANVGRNNYQSIYMGIGKKHKPAGFIASYHRISRKE